MTDFYAELNRVFLLENKSLYFPKLVKLLEQIKITFEERVNSSYKDVGKNILKELDISTLFNVNRELYSSCKAIIFSLKDYLLDTASAEKFENIPTSILK